MKTQQRRRSGSMAFQPRARVLKLIGEELISDEVVALAELVKNAHDADATTVSIRFEGVTDETGEIIIVDDGSGMDLETLLERWMQPAASTKSRERTTRKGRRVLGEKGVGRFAVDKLAHHLELTSQCQGSEDKLQAYFDWDTFDDEHRMLSAIKCKWKLIPDSSRKSHGTVLHLRGVRTRWNERMFRRLSLRLSRLLSPFRGQHDFRIILDSDEFPDYSGDLHSEILDGAPHGIDASFDGESTVRIHPKGSRPFNQPRCPLGPSIETSPVSSPCSAMRWKLARSKPTLWSGFPCCQWTKSQGRFSRSRSFAALSNLWTGYR